ncbi:GGDEF domain-containing protein [Caldimonas sp. KR1-144]|uniref:GGDEF domain-containing protein n=1 Tax=Caldimonas sp. KR1-144 TaxID=3400911 RepID=UPI003C05FB00
MSETRDAAQALRVLWVAEAGAQAEALAAHRLGPFELEVCPDRVSAAESVRARPFDAVVLALGEAEDARAVALRAWAPLAQDMAIVLIAPALEQPAEFSAWMTLGVQELLSADELDAGTLARALRASVERHRALREALRAHASDLTTGLPNQQQFVDQLSQLLALRQRQPAATAVVVLRIEGFSTVQASLGAEAANVLRRKVAVRLRSGVRASDMVAALPGDGYAVLLSALDQSAHALAVAAKLAASLRSVFRLGTQDVALAVAVGVSVFPSDGEDAAPLLQRAVGLAAGAMASGRAGFVNREEGGRSAAANDDELAP